MKEDSFGYWLRDLGLSLGAVFIGWVDLILIAGFAWFGVLAWVESQPDSEDIPRSHCLADDVPLFDDFQQEMVRLSSSAYRFFEFEEHSFDGKIDSVAPWLGRLAFTERFTPSGYVYRDPAAFVARFGLGSENWYYLNCDFIRAVVDARNWRPATAEDAERRRVVHAAEQIEQAVDDFGRRMRRLPPDGRSESETFDVRVELGGELFAVGRVTLTNILQGSVQGEGEVARLDGTLSRVRSFEPMAGSPLAAWAAFRERAEANYKGPVEIDSPSLFPKSTAEALPWTILKDVWVMPAR